MQIQVIDVPIGGSFIDENGYYMFRVLTPHDNGKALFDNNGRELVCAVTQDMPNYFFLFAEQVVTLIDNNTVSHQMQ